MPQPDLRSGISPGYQVFMLVLCIYSLGILAFQGTGPSEATMTILDYADLMVRLR